MKRTKLYDADATGRSTGATCMTVVVSTVLTTPSNAPAATTHAISVARLSIPAAITARSAATSTKAAASVGTSPRRSSSHGAAKTDVSASIRPQPKKMSPSSWAPSPSGKGV